MSRERRRLIADPWADDETGPRRPPAGRAPGGRTPSSATTGPRRRLAKWKGPPPASLVWSARLMLIGTALEAVVGVVFAVVLAGRAGYRAGALTGVVGAAVLVHVLVWLWMSTITRTGDPRAQFGGPAVHAAVTACLVAGIALDADSFDLAYVAVWALGTLAVAAMWSPSSRRYIAARGTGVRPVPVEDADDGWADAVIRRRPRGQ